MAEALRRGTVDCALYMAEAAAAVPELALLAQQMSGLHPFSAVPNVIGASMEAWEGLPAAMREIVEDAGAWVAWTTRRDSREPAGPADPPGFIRVEPFSSEDRATLRQAAFEAWAEMAEAAGPVAAQNRARVLAALRA
jgi:hypothetical protein